MWERKVPPQANGWRVALRNWELTRAVVRYELPSSIPEKERAVSIKFVQLTNATTREPTAYVPLSFAPGEAYQFDWSHEIVVMSGVTTTLKVAHVRLCHSRMMFVRAYPRESQEMVFDADDRRSRSSRARAPAASTTA